MECESVENTEPSAESPDRQELPSEALNQEHTEYVRDAGKPADSRNEHGLSSDGVGFSPTGFYKETPAHRSRPTEAKPVCSRARHIIRKPMRLQ